MKTLLAALALTGVLTSATLAEPIALTEAQLHTVTAGGSSVGSAGGGDCITRYGGGAGADPSVYGGGAGVDPSIVVPSNG
jgi:hypothetical protein